MSEIEIINDVPVIFTKDRAWLRDHSPGMEPGTIVLLPDDAVLYIPRLEYTQAVDFPQIVVRSSEHDAAKPIASPPPADSQGDTQAH